MPSEKSRPLEILADLGASHKLHIGHLTSLYLMRGHVSHA